MQCEALAKHSDVCVFIYYGIRYARLTNLGFFFSLFTRWSLILCWSSWPLHQWVAMDKMCGRNLWKRPKPTWWKSQSVWLSCACKLFLFFKSPDDFVNFKRTNLWYEVVPKTRVSFHSSERLFYKRKHRINKPQGVYLKLTHRHTMIRFQQSELCNTFRTTDTIWLNNLKSNGRKNLT